MAGTKDRDVPSMGHSRADSAGVRDVRDIPILLSPLRGHFDSSCLLYVFSLLHIG